MYLYSTGAVRRLIAGDQLVAALAVTRVQLEVRRRPPGHTDFDAAVGGRQVERTPDGLINGHVTVTGVGLDVRADAAKVDISRGPGAQRGSHVVHLDLAPTDP